MKTEQEFTPLVMTENVRAVTATEEIDLVYGQPIDERMAERLGPGKIKSLTSTRQAIPEDEFKKFDKARNAPRGEGLIPDVPADEATVEALSSEQPRGGARKIDDRPLPTDHPLYGRPIPADATAMAVRGSERVPMAGPTTTASEQLSQQRVPRAHSGQRPAWHGMKTEDLELDQATKDILIEAKLTTAGDILEEGRKNDGLQHIDGIGEGREQNIKNALEAIPKAEPVK